MSRSPIYAVALLLTPLFAAEASVCPTTNVIQDPPAFQWTNEGPYWSGTLEIGEASFVIGSDTLTTRAYRQAGGSFSVPGQTVRMSPGDTYVLTFKNLLPYQEASPEHNEFKDPNITNIHTHGLHVSGESPSDDITRLINGGYCGDYVYEVPANHMGGTLWYHAHHHGSTYLQVSAGAFGLLIVDDSQDGIPADVAAMTERQLAVGYLDPDVAGTGGDTLISGSLAPTWTTERNSPRNTSMPGPTCARSTSISFAQADRSRMLTSRASTDGSARSVSVSTGFGILPMRERSWQPGNATTMRPGLTPRWGACPQRVRPAPTGLGRLRGGHLTRDSPPSGGPTSGAGAAPKSVAWPLVQRWGQSQYSYRCSALGSVSPIHYPDRKVPDPLFESTNPAPSSRRMVLSESSA